MWKVVKQVQTVRPLILIGAGNLGTSLCSNYTEFEGKGLKIVAAFDNDPRKCGSELGHIKNVEHVSSIKRITKECGAKIAILAIPAEKAQEITKMCIEAGISTILNYSPISLNVPNHVHVEYMDPALKIQMTLSNTHHSCATNTNSYSAPPPQIGLHYTPLPPHLARPITPLLAPLQRYYHFSSRLNYANVTRRGFGTHNHTVPPLLHSNRYSSDFEEVGILGKGGFGSVYQARNRIDGMVYALKKIRININPGSLADITDHKYLREVRAMARLNHTNLVRYYYAWVEFDQQSHDTMSADSGSQGGNEAVSAYGSTDEKTCDSDTRSRTNEEMFGTANDGSGSASYSDSGGSSGSSTTYVEEQKEEDVKVILFIQMELCTGFTLKEWMARPERVVRIVECHTILTQLLQGLHHIHSHGFIHRDVTPPNIFLERFPKDIIVKIGDFGLAKQTGELKDAEMISMSRKGEKTVGVGTYLYASPEQFSNASYDTRADMYSVGVILFELLQPFNTQMERVFQLTQLRKGYIPPEISVRYPLESGIIECLLNEDPLQRLSAEEVLTRVKDMKN